MAGVLHDAVTLNHFGAAGAMDVLRERHGHLDPPRWTQCVHDEVATGSALGHSHCQAVMAAEPWLGTPVEPNAGDIAGIYDLWVRLNLGRTPPQEHEGEAESIYYAKRTGSRFATDDNGAYDFASQPTQLGMGRVIDTIDILRDAVVSDGLSTAEAHRLATAVLDAGRSLRWCHRNRLSPRYFE